MGYYQLKKRPVLNKLEESWIVAPKHACPGCGERHMTLLWWISNQSIRCRICGTKFRLTEDKSGVVAC